MTAILGLSLVILIINAVAMSHGDSGFELVGHLIAVVACLGIIATVWKLGT